MSVDVHVLQTLLNEYHKFAVKIDELNDVGTAYDASLKGVEIMTPVTRSKRCVSNSLFVVAWLGGSVEITTPVTRSKRCVSNSLLVVAWLGSSALVLDG